MKRGFLIFAGGAVVMTACWLFVGAVGAVPGYDASWYLIWGDQMVGGQKPDLAAWAAPTEHPLMLLVGLACALAGPHASQLLLTLNLVAVICLLPALMALGRVCLTSRESGAVGWLALIGGYALLLMALRGYLDIFFLLSVTVAAVLATERRTVKAALLLGLAGLLRPEAWLLALVFLAVSWKRLNRNERIALTASGVLPALLWLAVDGLITGNPLLAMDTARTLAFDQPGGAVPVFVSALFGGIRLPITVLALLGMVLAWRIHGWRRIEMPLLVGAAGLAIVVQIALQGLSLLPRYFLLADLPLALFAGFAMAGWTGDVTKPMPKGAWRLLGILAAVTAVFVALVLRAPGKLKDEIRLDRQVHGALTSLLASQPVRDGLRCGPLTFPSFRLIPDARLLLGSKGTIRARGVPPAPTSGVAMTVASTDKRIIDRYSRPGVKLPVDELPPPGFHQIATSGPFVAWARCASRSAGKG